MKSYFTFGQNHLHKIDGVIFDKDCVVEIEAKDSGEARDKMFDTFGAKWSFQYDSLPRMEFFPRGVIKL